MPKRPPAKQHGQGPREIAGQILDVHEVSSWLGFSEKSIRARVARREIPFHRWGRRLFFIKAELDRFFQQLPGCSIQEAQENHERRQ